MLNFLTSIRIKKQCADFIDEFFGNKQDFMRKSIEHYCFLSMKRIYEPVGYASFNENNIFGCVRYYLGYYLGRQFVLIINVDNAGFINHAEDYKRVIDTALDIQVGEEVDYYCQHKVDIIDGKSNWHNDKFAIWNFEKHCLDSDDGRLLSNADLMTLKTLMDMDKRQLISSRKAYVYEKLYGATIEWDENAKFEDRCKSIKYKGSVQ